MDPVYPNSEILPTGTKRVVEVVDCLADTVVTVTHVEEAQGTNTRKAYLVGLLVFFVIAGATFFSALSTTSSNKKAMREHLAAGKVLHEFRPERVSNGLGWVGAGSLALGFGLSFAFFVSRRKEKSSFVTEANSSGDPAFEMVGISSGIAKVRVHPSMSASLLNESGVISVVDLCKAGRAQQDTQGWVELCLEEGSTLSVVDGERRYHMSWTNRSKQKAVSAVWKWDSNFSAYVGASAVLALVFGLLVDAIPPESHTFDSDAFASNRRILSLKVIPTEPPLVEEMDEGDTGGESNEEAEAASTAGAKGTTGIETATNTRASMAIKRRSDTPSMSREQMRAVASHSGILGVSGSSQLFANINSNLNFASGDAFADLYGGQDGGPAGHQVGTLSGSWGSDANSISGTWGTTTKVSGRIPTLSYDTNGKCNKPGECRGTTGNVTLRKHEVKGPKLTLGPPKSSPGIDRAIIRRHIRRQLKRIRFCYEQRLVSSPSLSGTLVTSFTINANGAVLGTKSKGMGDSKMESCVSQVISSIQFPQVDGAGLVNVQYPFTFRPAGE